MVFGRLFTARILLLIALGIFYTASPTVRSATAQPADPCSPMNSLMQAGYRALEVGSYVVAGSKFEEATGYYGACYLYLVMNEKDKNPASAAAADYWGCYALTGQATAAFGQAKTADALKQIADAKNCFTGLIEGKDKYEVVSDGLRRLAQDGLAYVQTLESARGPRLPKIWLDWKAAHP